MITQFKIYLYGATIFGLILFLYFWHYKPIGEIEDVKKELEAKEIIIDLNQFQTKKEVFEEKQKAVKDTLQNKKEVRQDEINTSVGQHIIWIR